MRKTKEPYCGHCGATTNLVPRGTASTECRPCSSARARRAREKKPLKFILYRCRANAKTRGIEFNLKESDLPPIPEFCPIFGIKLTYEVGKGRSPSSLSLDRINSSKGYVPGNIRFVSDRANRLKGDATDKELFYLGKDASTRLSGLRVSLSPDESAKVTHTTPEAF